MQDSKIPLLAPHTAKCARDDMVSCIQSSDKLSTTLRNYTLDFLRFCNPNYKVTIMVRVANLQKKLVCRIPLLARALCLKAKQSSRNAKRDVRVSVYKYN